MNGRKVISVFLASAILLVVVGNSSAQSTPSLAVNSAAFDYPWRTHTVLADVSAIHYSTTLIEGHEYPGISYLQNNTLSFCKTRGNLPLHCYTSASGNPAIVPSTLSQVATRGYPDTFVAKWAYQPSFTNSVYVYWLLK